jgi:hypothetical protein
VEQLNTRIELLNIKVQRLNTQVRLLNNRVELLNAKGSLLKALPLLSLQIDADGLCNAAELSGLAADSAFVMLF